MKISTIELKKVSKKYQSIKSCLTEKSRRRWSAAEALSYGHGGILLVNKATNISKNTIIAGIKELKNPKEENSSRIRNKGGGRTKLSQKYKSLLKKLEELVDPTAKGNPESHLRWTSKSTRNLETALKEKGFSISHSTIATLLNELGYSLQVNKKTLEGTSHPDRNAQFHYINASITIMQNLEQPTISVDTKKKENIGNYKNNGKEFSKKRTPTEVQGHDFPDKKLGKVVPYGVYDIGKNKGWVSVGISSDTAEFAVNSIRTWWYKMGAETYPKAKELMITADCGGSNGYRTRLWKFELQRFADETGLKIHVRHFPPGTSKWNKIEHRLFSYISKNWRGKPLLTHETVVNLIGNTRTKAGLKVNAILDENEYKKGIEISKKEFDAIQIIGDNFHPEWNYTIDSRKK